MRLFFISSLVCFFSTFLSPSQILVFEPIGRFGPLCVVIVDRTSLSLSLTISLSLFLKEKHSPFHLPTRHLAVVNYDGNVL